MAVRWLVSLAAVVSFPVVAANAADDKTPPPPDRVGRVIVEGNRYTPDPYIVGILGLRPGQILDYPALERSRVTFARLARHGLFDPQTPPTVELLPNESDGLFKDVRVRIADRPWFWLLFAANDGLTAVIRGDLEVLGETVELVREGLPPVGERLAAALWLWEGMTALLREGLSPPR